MTRVCCSDSSSAQNAFVAFFLFFVEFKSYKYDCTKPVQISSFRGRAEPDEAAFLTLRVSR